MGFNSTILARICLLVLVGQVYSLNCNITSIPKIYENGHSAQPYFYFTSDQKPQCLDVSVKVSFAFNGSQCKLNKVQTFICDNSTAGQGWKVLMWCNDYYSESDITKTINITGTAIFLETNETCTVQGTTSMQWINPNPDTDPGSPTWPIIVGVVAGVLVIGGVAGYFIWRHFQKKKQQGT